VQIQEEWRAWREAEENADPGARVSSRRGRRRRTASSPAAEQAARVWELVGWITAALLLCVAGAGLFAFVPLPFGPFGSSARAGLQPASAPVPSRRTNPLKVPGEPVPAVGTARPQQAAAPEVVSLMVGGLSDEWTFESIGGETTLRVQVETSELGEAFLRAALALRTSSGRQAWSRLGADRLELRSDDAAITLEVAKRAVP
jgi:hypothetical protein